MSRTVLAIAANVALALACLAAPAAHAQDSVEERLSFDRLAPIVPGVYVAGDRIGFSLDASGGEFLLRMDGTPEVFVLYPTRASLGGRVLKFDSGETAMLVAGWGGMTLYTDAQPGGLPAVRTGDSVPPSPPSVSLSEMQAAAGDDGQRLGYVRHLNLSFTADWNALASDSTMRTFAYDAMENAARGLDRFAAFGPAREALVKRVNAVSIQTNSRPTIALNGRTLVVTYNPGRGFEGRASSRAIAHALSTLLSVPQK
jgi:uncharacterized protein DUF4908